MNVSETIGQIAQGSAKEKVPSKCGQPQHIACRCLGAEASGFPGGRKGLHSWRDSTCKGTKTQNSLAGGGEQTGEGVSPRREQHSCKRSGLEVGMTPILLKSILGLLQPSESHEPSPHNRGMRWDSGCQREQTAGVGWALEGTIVPLRQAPCQGLQWWGHCTWPLGEATVPPSWALGRDSVSLSSRRSFQGPTYC